MAHCAAWTRLHQGQHVAKRIARSDGRQAPRSRWHRLVIRIDAGHSLASHVTWGQIGPGPLETRVAAPEGSRCSLSLRRPLIVVAEQHAGRDGLRSEISNRRRRPHGIKRKLGRGWRHRTARCCAPGGVRRAGCLHKLVERQYCATGRTRGRCHVIDRIARDGCWRLLLVGLREDVGE